MSADLDQYEFVELAGSRRLAAEARPDVAVRVSRARGPLHGGKLRATLLLRGGAAGWVESRGTDRFRVSVGGATASVLRLRPDPDGTVRIGRQGGRNSASRPVMGVLGRVDLWPDEERALTAASSWREEGGSLLIFLPEEFARASRRAAGAGRSVDAAARPGLAGDRR